VHTFRSAKHAELSVVSVDPEVSKVAAVRPATFRWQAVRWTAEALERDKKMAPATHGWSGRTVEADETVL